MTFLTFQAAVFEKMKNLWETIRQLHVFQVKTLQAAI